ncbi:MAG TPA: DNA-binding protein [Arachnia sp.]|nr:DNA-binding protein [Arachnia sp.]HMT86005.1 DNA-binding protein [Arachnia sp.]
MTKTMGDRLKRFFWSPEQLEAEDLQEASKSCGATPLAACRPRQRVTVRGTIASVTSGDRHGWLTAEVRDGTGSVQLIWMGHSEIRCVLPGRSIKASGCTTELDGRLAIYNPEFEMLI